MLNCQRSLFSLPEDIHYLNCAYMSPLLKSVEEAGILGLRKKSLPHTISGKDFFDMPTRSRELFASLINAKSYHSVSILPSVSYGTAIVAKNLKARKGQNIVSVVDEFPSNIYAWREHLENGVEMKLIAPKSDSLSHAQDWNDAICEAINENTALVIISTIHWTDGTVFDLKRIAASAKKVGAMFVLDGTQSIGALPFDVQEINPDALIAASYKCMMGVYSIGFAYWGERFSDAVPIEETWVGRKGSEDFRNLVNYQNTYNEGMSRFNVGEMANFALIPAINAALEQLLLWQPARVQEYCKNLNKQLAEALANTSFSLRDSSERAEHLYGISIPSTTDCDKLQAELAKRKVYVSLRGNFIRVAPNVYNTNTDIEALADALRQSS